MSRREPLALGVFMPNCSNMPSISTHGLVPEQWQYPNNERIAQLAESLGFEYLFPVSRWRGFGGETDYLGTSLETTTWAAALLRATQRIKIFSTVHVPLFHPMVIAKIGATLAHISGDRWGLNVVSGWSQREFDMMGLTLDDHSRRYERTSAFIKILRGLWDNNGELVNHRSDWYSIKDGISLPRPKKMPDIANAGVSADAQAMTARLCDWSFMSGASIDALPRLVDAISAQAEAQGRRVKTAIFPFLLWRDTETEAQAELEKIIAHKDGEAAHNWLNDISAGSGSFDEFTENLIAASGGGLPLLGDAEMVAEQLRAIYNSGVDAVMITLQDYERDLQRFGNDIAPILRRMGVIL
ncbi:hypothetical protein CWI75_01355 [Kineobactrum sediminis]|uniref:Luciferase-like domain-containing protein n=1 Tax=Kineobactrum sediminis TaxID=1905677 RepID=A0A2N5Y6K3_9GAMM|nr:LLM class flavin-dependent oxidoreductase [Kineobactrum sediminis]PLW84028.1 hypothetical protein CWI75_01355 [Kineobactrum sediminis]